jgi:acyl-CoA dehydrogenase
VYGQLILEKARMDATDPDLLNQIFDVFVRDFSIYATALHGKPGNSEEQRMMILQLIKAPVADPQQFERVWRERVLSLKGQYRLAD